MPLGILKSLGSLFVLVTLITGTGALIIRDIFIYIDLFNTFPIIHKIQKHGKRVENHNIFKKKKKNYR